MRGCSACIQVRVILGVVLLILGAQCDTFHVWGTARVVKWCNIKKSTQHALLDSYKLVSANLIP